MAIKIATNNGNWSSGSTWEDGIVPTTGDEVYINGYNVTLDVNLNVATLSQYILPYVMPNTAVPQMTANNLPSGIANASGSNALSENPWRAFARTAQFGTNAYWQSNTLNSGWISYQFTSAKTIKRYVFRSYFQSNDFQHHPKTWTFEGSNDGTNWTVLHSVSAYTLNYSYWYVSPDIGNTTAYTYYRLNVTETRSGGRVLITSFEMSESTVAPYFATVTGDQTTGALRAGGSFNMSVANITVTANLIQGYTTNTFINHTAASPSICTINGTTVYGGSGVAAILHSGTGRLDFYGTLYGSNIGNNAGTITTTGNSGVVNVTGNVYGSNVNTQAYGIYHQGSGVVNIVGDLINQYSSRWAVVTNTTNTTNITGNLYGISSGSNGLGCIYAITGNPTINITGTLNSLVNGCIQSGSGYPTFNITGNMTAGAYQLIYIWNNTGAVNHVGTITTTASTGNAIFMPINGSVFTTTASNLVNNNGAMLIVCARINFTTDLGRSWVMQKEDLSNITLYSPEQIAVTGSHPIPSNVRSGVSYALGAYTGTLVMPTINQVAYNVDVDATKGISVLSSATARPIADAVWNQLTANINTAGSIGERLENVSTVAITGQQIAGFDI